MITLHSTKLNLIENSEINVINIKTLTPILTENSNTGKITITFSEKIYKIYNFSEKLQIEFDIIEEETK